MSVRLHSASRWVLRGTLWLLLAGSSRELRAQAELEARLDRAFRDSARANRYIGAQVAVSIPGRPLWTATYGENGPGIPMTADALLGTGSISKMFAAVSVLTLIDRGTLSYADTLARWFPASPGVPPSIPLGALLRHQSGLTDYGTHPSFGDSIRADRARAWRPGELMAFIRPPSFAPGTAWAASNSDRLLLGMIVAGTVGSTYADYLRRVLFVEGQGEVWTPGQSGVAAPRIATHWVRDSTGVPVNFSERFFGPSLFTARIETYISARELVRFARRLFDGALLSPAARDSMLRIVADDRRIPGQTGGGIGIRRFDLLGRLMYGNSGGTPNSSAFVLYDPASGVIVALSINQGGPSHGNSHFRVAPALVAIGAGGDAPVAPGATILLARHGESDYDPSRPLRPGVRPDPGLTAQGRAQADSLARALRSQGVTRVVTSPLRRARETGAIVAAVLGVPLTTDSTLAEFDPGDLLGRDWSQSPFREQFDSLLGYPDMRRPGGESALELRRRATAGLSRLAAGHPGETLAIISHGLTNRSILGYLRAEPQTVALRRAAQASTRVYRFTWPPHGLVAIDSL